MKDKIILKALHRILSEKCIELRNKANEISILNHQTECYLRMNEEVKEKVIKNLFLEMKRLGWNDWIKEIKESKND